ncbi:CSC1-like protein [Hibiscus syriacus]|uniref:CSC1-like protein n=1 Tax=Hibiscus syriacus TaxID=106335 RepID=A0A6A3BLC0_HIBSY|nr:CSC1-like protein [Hibiscus syriacus]
MDIGGLITSAGINISICVVLSSLYSVLRKQPSNAGVYFTRRFISEPIQHDDPFGLHRFVPSAGWLMRAWQATDEELLEACGVDAVVFMRIVVFSLRIFIIATVVCISIVLPVNYYGRDIEHKSFRVEPYDVFTIGNVEEGSKMLWAHCFALYVISFSAFVLLYLEYKSITKMRLAHITGSHRNPSHFTILVRGVPCSQDESYSKSVENFFSTYYPDTYVAHQMIYRPSTVHKLKKDVKKMYLMLRPTETEYVRIDKPCYLCGGTAHTFKVIHKDNSRSQTRIDDLHPTQIEKECPAAFVFFKNRYAAVIAAQVLQSWNPIKFILRSKEEPTNIALNFPHHTEIPRMLLFGLLGFTFAILAPLILPFLLIYFALAFLVYRNQILHVYVTKYESAGLFWPVVHNTTIFSLMLTQVIAVAVFALKEAPIASGFTIPLVVFSLLFNEYCRKRFSQVFKRSPAQVLIEMDRRDEQMGREEGFYNQLRSAYCQLAYITKDLTISEDFSRAGPNRHRKDDEDENSPKSGQFLLIPSFQDPLVI